MKSIGPYVISATPSGAVVNGHAAGQAGSPARADSAPLHGLDRLTGMPVLLHRLPVAVVPAAIPISPHLLPVFEVQAWDGQPYAVTELPLAAIPATHTDSAALGALRGLAALHAAGQVHGGLNAGQLWQIGREVRLAGAGLPWQPDAGTRDDSRAPDLQALDMAALGRTLDALGVRPAALASLETMTAALALEALEKASAAQAQPVVPQRRQGAPTPPALSPPPALPPPSEAPVSRVDEPVAPPPGASVPPATPEPLPDAAAPEAEPALPAPSSEVQAPEPPADPPRYRAAADVIVLGETAPAEAAPVAPAPEEPPAASPPEASAPAAEPLPTLGKRAPIRIGFDGPPELLPDWTPTDAQPQPTAPEPEDGPAPEVVPRARQARPEPLSSEPAVPDLQAQDRPDQVRTGRYRPGRPGSSLDMLPPAAPLPATPLAATPLSATLPPANRGQPLRIGWEEDHSWRVVKSGPERRRVSAPRLPAGAQRLLLVALVLLAVAGGWFWYSAQLGPPASGCCTQRFTVSGSSQPVTVTLVLAPPGSPLQPGALIGTAPGTLKIQGNPGRYLLKFSAAGHRPIDGAVQVPSERPFSIVLK